MTDEEREERVESYYQESARELAERLVETEEELEMWRAQALDYKETGW